MSAKLFKISANLSSNFLLSPLRTVGLKVHKYFVPLFPPYDGPLPMLFFNCYLGAVSNTWQQCKPAIFFD